MRVDITVPQRWNDLTEWQVRMIGRFLFNQRNQKSDAETVRWLLVIILIIPTPTTRNLSKAFLLLFKIPLAQLEELADFIFDKSQHMTRFPNYIKVGRWPLKKKLYGPAARLANVKIKELSYADTFYYKWATDDADIDLHRLVAILYRPKSTAPIPVDIRSPFSELLLEQNAKLTDLIPLHVKYMIAHAYHGSRELFVDRHPHVFPRRKSQDQEDPVQKKKPKYQPFSKIVESMAMDEVQVFGTLQEAEEIFAPKFFAVYEECLIRQAKNQR